MSAALELPIYCERIRVRGIVQGVGFRPTVWRIANALGVRGHVGNDGEGVFIEAWADPHTLQSLVDRILQEAPPLARIEGVQRGPGATTEAPPDFRIVVSTLTAPRTHVAPDAAVCAACAVFGWRFEVGGVPGEVGWTRGLDGAEEGTEEGSG